MGGGLSVLTDANAADLSPASLEKFYLYEEEIEEKELPHLDAYLLLTAKYSELLKEDLAVQKPFNPLVTASPLAPRPGKPLSPKRSNNNLVKKASKKAMKLQSPKIVGRRASWLGVTDDCAPKKQTFSFEETRNMSKKNSTNALRLPPLNSADEDSSKKKCAGGDGSSPATPFLKQAVQLQSGAHDNDKFTCKLCKKDFDSELTLQTHMKHSQLHTQELERRNAHFQWAYQEAERKVSLMRRVFTFMEHYHRPFDKTDPVFQQFITGHINSRQYKWKVAIRKVIDALRLLEFRCKYKYYIAFHHRRITALHEHEVQHKAIHAAVLLYQGVKFFWRNKVLSQVLVFRHDCLSDSASCAALGGPAHPDTKRYLEIICTVKTLHADGSSSSPKPNGIEESKCKRIFLDYDIVHESIVLDDDVHPASPRKTTGSRTTISSSSSASIVGFIMHRLQFDFLHGCGGNGGVPSAEALFVDITKREAMAHAPLLTFVPEDIKYPITIGEVGKLFAAIPLDLTQFGGTAAGSASKKLPGMAVPAVAAAASTKANASGKHATALVSSTQVQDYKSRAAAATVLFPRQDAISPPVRACPKLKLFEVNAVPKKKRPTLFIDATIVDEHDEGSVAEEEVVEEEEKSVPVPTVVSHDDTREQRDSLPPLKPARRSSKFNMILSPLPSWAMLRRLGSSSMLGGGSSAALNPVGAAAEVRAAEEVVITMPPSPLHKLLTPISNGMKALKRFGSMRNI